jgi:hypothetical protein
MRRRSRPAGRYAPRGARLACGSAFAPPERTGDPVDENRGGTSVPGVADLPGCPAAPAAKGAAVREALAQASPRTPRGPSDRCRPAGLARIDSCACTTRIRAGVSKGGATVRSLPGVIGRVRDPVDHRADRAGGESRGRSSGGRTCVACLVPPRAPTASSGAGAGTTMRRTAVPPTGTGTTRTTATTTSACVSRARPEVSGRASKDFRRVCGLSRHSSRSGSVLCARPSGRVHRVPAGQRAGGAGVRSHAYGVASIPALPDPRAVQERRLPVGAIPTRQFTKPSGK